MQVKRTGRKALETFLLHQSCPDLKRLGLQEKLLKDHDYRNYVQFVERDDPLSGQTWRNKQHAGRIAKRLHVETSDDSKPIEQREKELMEKASEQAHFAAQLTQREQAMEGVIAEENAQKRK